MKLYTFYTESHHSMFENFLKKSVNHFNEYKLVVGTGKQHCSDGGFFTENFTKTCFEKIKFMIDSNEWTSNEVIMFSDVDVLFLNKTKDIFLKELGNLDMIFQNDGGTCNLGVYLCRKNFKVKSLFEKILTFENQFHNSQIALNHIINLGLHGINYKLFDYKVWNVKFQGLDPWDGSSNINFPEDILLFHANYIVGVELKSIALKLAYDKLIKPNFPIFSNECVN